MIHLTRKQAREYLVKYHMINTDDSLSDKEGILTVFDKIQSIQVDPLDVVGRNVDLVLQARVQNYKKYFIEELLYKDRTIIDGWDKMMAIYKTEDYPKFQEVRKWRSNGEINTLHNRLQIDALKYLDAILEIFEKEGPKFSKDISIGGKSKHIWGQTKISSAAIDYLFHKGDINVNSRKNQQKEYDLTHRLIGDLANQESPFNTTEEFIEYFLLRRIKALGLTTNKSGVHLHGTHISSKKIREQYIKILLEKDLIEEVTIESIKEICYIPKGALNQTNIIKDSISFIAPLDNLIWDRDLTYRLFDFHYRWEVYTPIVKREYGYYVLPILYKENLIGRIEFEKHRKGDLKIINIWYNENTKQTKKLETKMNQALRRFQKYLGK